MIDDLSQQIAAALAEAKLIPDHPPIKESAAGVVREVLADRAKTASKLDAADVAAEKIKESCFSDSLASNDYDKQEAAAIIRETVAGLEAELDGVMYAVDKWFDDDSPLLKNNPATRASNAREIALRAIEEAGAERDRQYEQNAEFIVQIAALERERDRLATENAALKAKYSELLMAVSAKHPSETRHETAHRYLKEKEANQNEHAAGKSTSQEMRQDMGRRRPRRIGEEKEQTDGND